MRGKKYSVTYKGIKLAHNYYADFILYNEIIFEVKACAGIAGEHLSQTINYMKLADSHLGMIVNFNIRSFQHKRVVL